MARKKRLRDEPDIEIGAAAKARRLRFRRKPETEVEFEGRSRVRSDDRIEDVRFTSAGCAVSRAAASIMTQSVKGKSREDVDRLFGVWWIQIPRRFHNGSTTSGDPPSTIQLSYRPNVRW